MDVLRGSFSYSFLVACDVSLFQFVLAVSLHICVSSLRAHSLHKALPCLPHFEPIISGRPLDCLIPCIREMHPPVPSGRVELWMLSLQGSLCVLDFWWGFLFSIASFCLPCLSFVQHLSHEHCDMTKLVTVIPDVPKLTEQMVPVVLD